MQLYLVKDLARLTGHSTNTVKFYLQKGLLREYGRSPFTNIRFFDETSVQRLLEIRRMRKEGASIKEIQALFISENWTPAFAGVTNEKAGSKEKQAAE